MGVVSPRLPDASFHQSLAPRILAHSAPQASTPAVPATNAAAAPGAEALTPNPADAIRQQYDSAVYTSRVQRMALALQIQQAAARVAGDEEGSEASAEARQLRFSFFAETREEELALFRERTNATADRMSASQRGSYLATSRRVAMRFSMSIEMSGAALSGYSNATEGLPAAESDVADRFMAFVNDMLGKSNDMLNEVFDLMGAFFSGEGDFETRVNQFLSGLQDSGFLSLPSLSSGGSGQSLSASSFSMNIQLEFEFEMVEGQVQESDPIMLDLDGDGFELSNYANGATFDITGRGSAVRTAFVTGGDAFLALDRNGNGAIDDGTELFGDQRGAANGYEELRALDSNGDGRINASDRDFEQLRLWRDNGNGVTEEGELVSLRDAGVSELSLAYRNVNQIAMGGNRLTQLASFARSDGTYGNAADAMLRYTALA